MILSGPAADQWGLVTAAQAKKLGLNAVQLKRLTEAGLLESVGRGVYALAAAGLPEHLEAKVAWLRLQPEAFAWERPVGDRDSGVISHASACQLHGLGDIPAPSVEISVPRRRTTTEPFVRLRTAQLKPADITVIDGLPVTAAERTIVDLLQTKADGGHIGGVIADAERRDLVDIEALAARVQRFTRNYGLPSAATGHELIEHMVEQAGRQLHSQELDAASLEGFAAAAQLLSTQDLAANALVSYLHSDAAADQALDPYIRSLAAHQPALQDLAAKTLYRSPAFETLQETLRQLRHSPAMVKLLRDANARTAALKTLQQARFGDDVLTAVQAAQRAIDLSPSVRRAMQQAIPPNSAVAQAAQALKQLSPAPTPRAEESAPDEALLPGEETQKGLNDVPGPE